MENAALVGLSRQIALRRELDVVANNIANINTSGYKSDNVVFHEYLMPGARANHFRVGDRQLSFVQDRATWLDLAQGPVQQTGNPLDVAVGDSAFLTVETPRGESYTRNGALQISSTGQLITSEGYPVIGQNGPIVFQRGDTNVAISTDGTISVREGDSIVDSPRGKLRLASFDQPQRLEKDGTSTYMPPAGMEAQVPETVRVVQGAVEKSNVSGVLSMTRMIEVTRTYTQIAGMLQQQADMRRAAIEKLAEVPN